MRFVKDRYYESFETKEYKKWIKEYRYIPLNHGNPLSSYLIPANTDIKNLWSYTLNDSCTFIVNGIWHTNNEGFFITELPWSGKPGDIFFMAKESDGIERTHYFFVTPAGNLIKIF